MKSLLLGLWLSSALATDIGAEKSKVLAESRLLLNQVVSAFNAAAGGKIHAIAAKNARYSQIFDDLEQAEIDYKTEKQRCFTLPADQRVACLDRANDIYRQTEKSLEDEKARLPGEIDRLEREVAWEAKSAAAQKGTEVARLAFANGFAFEGATSLYLLVHESSLGRRQTLAVGEEGWGLGHSMYHKYYDPRRIRIETAAIAQTGHNGQFDVSVTGRDANNVEVAISGKFEPLMDGGSCSAAASLYRIFNPDGKIEGIPVATISPQQRTFFEWALGKSAMDNSPWKFLEMIERCAHFVSDGVRVYKNNSPIFDLFKQSQKNACDVSYCDSLCANSSDYTGCMVRCCGGG